MSTISGWRCRKCKSTHLEMYDLGLPSAHNDVIVKKYWYETESGKRVYDFGAMEMEFETILKELKDEQKM